MTKEAQKRASKKYDQKNTKMLSVKLNKNTDADILQFIAGIGNKQLYIKRLIRNDMFLKSEEADVY